MRLSREELFERVRRDRRVDPAVSIRELSRRYGVGRVTIRTALGGAVPRPRKVPVPRATVLTPVAGVIDAMLREDVSAPRKQRHTIDRIQRRLAVEFDFDAPDDEDPRRTGRLETLRVGPAMTSAPAGTAGREPARPASGSAPHTFYASHAS